MNFKVPEPHNLKEKWLQIDQKVDQLMNQIYKSQIDEYKTKHPKINAARFNWIFCISRIHSLLDNEEGEKLVRHLSRLVFMIGFDLVKYSNFITDGGSGILVEHFFSELLLMLCEKYKLPYVPPKEIEIAGGGGSENRIQSIEKALKFEGVDLGHPTLFITEYTRYANTMMHLFAGIPGLRNVDYLTLGIGDEKFTENKIRANFGLNTRSKVYSGGTDVFFKSQTPKLGHAKEFSQTGAYTNVPHDLTEDSFGERSEYKLSRDVLNELAKSLLPIYTLLE